MPILIGSLPTTQKDDWELAGKILNKRENIFDSTQILESRLQKLFKKDDMYLFNRGREALYFILKTLGVSQKDEVIIQAMTCVAVVTPILWLNANPIYVDIKRKDYNIDIEELKKKITDKTKVIIVQHTFGNVADIEKISEVAKKHGVYVIEDCAHLFYSAYNYTKINKYSDASFFSFAQDKSISSTQGGLAVISSPKLKASAMAIYLNIEDQTWLQASYNARYIRLWWLIKKYYFTPLIPFQKRITIGKVLVILLRKLSLIRQQASSLAEKKPKLNRMSSIQSRLLLNQLEKCGKLNKHREEIVKIYNENLSKELRNKSETKYLLRYPLVIANPGVMMHQLRMNKYICGSWYNSIVFPIRKSFEEIGYTRGCCPIAESIVEGIINLPTDINVSREDALKIADIVNRYAKPFNFSK